LLPEQVVSAQCPKLPELDIWGTLNEALPLGPATAAFLEVEIEHDVVTQNPSLPPLHATGPFGLVIQLACALCTGIAFTTIITTAAVTRANVTAAIVTEVFSLCIFFVSLVLIFTLALL
jgi:hypothetical protein